MGLKLPPDWQTSKAKEKELHVSGWDKKEGLFSFLLLSFLLGR
jgi:hypothetical protein